MMIVWSAVATSVFGVQAMNEPIQFLEISLNAQLNERYFQEMTKLTQLNEWYFVDEIDVIDENDEF